MKIGELIQTEISKKGLTQKEVAAMIGKSTTALNQIIKGTYNPSPKTVEKISDALNIEIKFYAVKKKSKLEILPYNKLIEGIDLYLEGQRNHIITRTPERMRTIEVVADWCKKIAKNLIIK